MIKRLLKLVRSRAFVVFLGTMPLLFLTLNSCFDAVAQYFQSHVTVVEEGIDEVKAKAGQADAKAKLDRPQLVRLGRLLLTPYRDNPLSANPNPAPASAECQLLLSSWNDFGRSRILVATFIETMDTLLDPGSLPTELEDEWLEQPSDAVVRLTDLLTEVANSVTSLAELKQRLDPVGATPDEPTRNILKLIDSLAITQKDGTSRIERMRANLTTLVAAEKAYRIHDYEGCSNDLASWKGTIPATVNTLKQSADFKNRAVKWTTIASNAWVRGPSGQSWQSLVDEASRILVDYPLPPSSTAAVLHGTVKEIQLCIQARLKIEALGEPQSLSRWIREASVIQTTYDCDKNRKQFSNLVVAWMAKGLPPMLTPESESAYEVASLTSGNLLVGVFKKQGNSGFKRWETPSQYAVDIKRIRYTVWVLAKFKRMPAPPPTIEAIDTYTSERKNLNRQPTNEDSWKKFLAACKLQEDRLTIFERKAEIVTYRKSTGTIRITLAQQIKFAEEILGHWKELEPFLE